MDQEVIKNEIEKLLKQSIQKQLLVPRPSLSYDGTPKPVNKRYPAPLPSPKIASSTLFNSVDVFFETDLKDGQAQVVVDFGSADWWYFVDQGRRPSFRFPNISDIRGWVSQKGALNYPDLSIDQRTFLVARSIKEYGFKGINFLQTAFKDVENQLTDKFGDYAGEYLRTILQKDVIVEWEKQFKYDKQDKQMLIKIDITQ